MIVPHHNEYEITYIDKNKILFDDHVNVNGVVDLNAKTVTETIHKHFPEERVQTEHLLTNPDEIQKEEKRIIKGYLKRRFFEL